MWTAFSVDLSWWVCERSVAKEFWNFLTFFVLWWNENVKGWRVPKHIYPLTAFPVRSTSYRILKDWVVLIECAKLYKKRQIGSECFTKCLISELSKMETREIENGMETTQRMKFREIPRNANKEECTRKVARHEAWEKWRQHQLRVDKRPLLDRETSISNVKDHLEHLLLHPRP